MNPDLLAHLREGMETPFDRATGHDCSFFAVDWIVKATGIDPAADLRGTYTNEVGAARQIIRWGGYVQMWRVHMATAGFNTTTFPQEGDVGVVLDAAGQTISAIRFDQKWAAKTTRGVIVEDFSMLVAWSLKRG